MPEEQKKKLKISCPACHARLDVSDLEPFSVFDCPSCRYSITVPRRFLNYVLEERLSSNGGVEFYRALDATLDREAFIVALDSRCHSQEQLEGCLRLVRKASSVSHPGWATIYSCGMYEGGAYAAYQFMAGGTCLEAEGRGVSWTTARSWLLGAAEALQKAAESGIAHGGISDKTILRDENGALKIIGLGLGQALGRSVGGDAFDSPERKAGVQAAVSSDMYSLGVWAYRLLTGWMPDGEALLSSAGAWPAEVPQAVVEQLRRMMSASVLKRPAGYLGLIEALSEEGGEVQAAKAAQRTQRVMVKGRREAAVPEDGGKVKIGWGAALALAALVLLMAGGTVWFVRGRSDVEGAAVVSAGKGRPAMAGAGVFPDTVPEDGGEVDMSFLEEDVTEETDVAVADTPRVPKAYRRRRPRPADFDFNGDDGKRETNASYIKSLPDQYVELEKERLRIVSSMKSYMYMSLMKMPYRPEEGGELLLADGRRLKGFIPMGAENNGLVVRMWDGGEPPLQGNLRLEDLAWEEIWRMLDYYGMKRIEMAGDGARERREAFDHYLNAALLCDWYGQRRYARDLAKKGLRCYPRGLADIRKFGF